MSNTLRDRLRLSRTDDNQQTTRLRALVEALGLTVGGAVFSFLVFLIYRPTVIGMLEPVSPNFSSLAVSKATQIGFFLFVGGYVFLTGRWDRLQFSRPSVRDLVWVVLGTVGLEIAAEGTTWVLTTMSIPIDPITGSMDVGLMTWPSLAPFVFLGLYLLPAMAEEQFFRGFIQERLLDGFHPVTAIVLSSVCFTLAHGLYGLGGGAAFLVPYFAYLFPQGIVFCTVYDRTQGVLVVATVHALSWTNLTLLPFL
ncbi:CPBP family intramembrane glutamic endopeptidase [Halocatena salina]|uniref:CPBP family intramembrane metalloprotease n=1 Tax=Halocatena salina TaxID=2934340 RepID=A0A8U0A0D5_9EURY|nr:type II CAAX endopeptidase family protein [Halocatena salina]UPM42306.1 CPBP family intramembrane metalloprotease [Halocatena salina]